VSWRVSPVEQGYWTDLDADAVSGAHFPVNSYVRSVNSEFLRRLNGSPDIVAVVLADNFAVFLKLGVYWQTFFTCVVLGNP
jgi:hypothetical protein